MTTDIIISVNGLEKHFDEGKLKALRGVDADIHKGEVVVVIGPPAPANPPSCAA